MGSSLNIRYIKVFHKVFAIIALAFSSIIQNLDGVQLCQMILSLLNALFILN